MTYMCLACWFEECRCKNGGGENEQGRMAALDYFNIISGSAGNSCSVGVLAGQETQRNETGNHQSLQTEN